MYPCEMVVDSVGVTVKSHACLMCSVSVQDGLVATSAEFQLLVLLTLVWSHYNVAIVSPSPIKDSAQGVVPS
jgi:hypothetical protein